LSNTSAVPPAVPVESREEITPWLSGFLEGEGSFFWAKGNRHTVKAVQIDPECLERIQRVFGGSITLDRKQRNGHHPIWVWTLTGRRAWNLMREMRPLMSAKRRKQIDKALEYPPRETTYGARV